MASKLAPVSLPTGCSCHIEPNCAFCAAQSRAAQERRSIEATPYACRDPHTLAPRQWLYGRQLLRGSLSVIVAPGGTGKTSLLVGTALAISTGRPLLGKTPWEGPGRVWLWNLEDSLEELAKLIEAARIHWRIGEEDIGGRLFVDSALDGAELCIATEDNAGFRMMEPVVEALTEEIERRQIDVLVVDPFVSSHRVSENSNTAIDAIAKKWAQVSARTKCAVCLVHHVRKGNGSETNADSARGASALPNAARSVIALNRMTADEAISMQVVGEDRRYFFRAYDDKNNRAPPADKSDWYRLISVSLGNATQDRPSDEIGVVIPWTPTDAFTGVTTAHLLALQERVTQHQYRKSDQAADWVGLAIADVLDLDVDDRKGPDAKRAKQLLKTWMGNGALIEIEERD